MTEIDCDFYYFKPGGKWKYEGQGRFPHTLEIDRNEILRENGTMPGLTKGYHAEDLMIVIVPRENCDAEFAYPRILNPVARNT